MQSYLPKFYYVIILNGTLCGNFSFTIQVYSVEKLTTQSIGITKFNRFAFQRVHPHFSTPFNLWDIYNHNERKTWTLLQENDVFEMWQSLFERTMCRKLNSSGDGKNTGNLYVTGRTLSYSLADYRVTENFSLKI